MDDENIAAPDKQKQAPGAAVPPKVMRRVGEEEKLPFTTHLEELRQRLIYCLVTVGVVFMAVYAVSGDIYQFVRKPIGIDLVFLSPTEAFFVYLKLSIYVAVMISTPMLLYQAWEFVAPGLLAVERRYTGAFVVIGTLFFAIGAAFCYFAVLPIGLQFLIGYGGEGLKPMISVGNYLSFVFMFTLAFGIIFEMPLVIVFLASMGLVTPDWLAKQRSYFIVGDFVVAAILTPTPDVVSQLMMAVPMMILFEAGLFAARFFTAKKQEEPDGQTD
ncbi:MAG: twin-arginine translocase subunit TatC [Nitrospinae bacterium]|nr:twin-arginine translocase subunit TatC [Nitrospinota bacterium]